LNCISELQLDDQVQVNPRIDGRCGLVMALDLKSVGSGSTSGRHIAVQQPWASRSHTCPLPSVSEVTSKWC